MSTDNEWIDIMRAGTWHSRAGVPMSFTPDDLEAMAQSFDEGQRRVPLVLGHPSTDSPAYGWVDKLRRMGDVLQARFKQVPEAVKELVRNGQYKNVSISVFPDRSLRHVGLLGAVQPAVPGLREVSFEEGGEVYEFDFSLQDAATQDRDVWGRIAELEAELDKERQERKRLEHEFAEVESEYTAFRETTARENRERRVKNLISEGKILPRDAAEILEFAAALADSDKTYDFAMPDGSMETVSAEERYLRGWESRKHNHTGLLYEFATRERAEGPIVDAKNEKESGRGLFDKV